MKRRETRAPKPLRLCGFLSFVFVLLWPSAPFAERLDAILIAEQPCPATVSIKRPDNPGSIRLVPGQGYRVVGTNRADPSHYRLRFEDANPKERWVEIRCGHLEDAPATAAAADARQGPPTSARAGSMDGQLVLAASWQPAFCELRTTRPECRDQTPERPDARRFSLHGLWPQPIGNSYCGVGERERTLSSSGQWRRLPALDLDATTRARLNALMPGTLSDLQRHEWFKHGTCYGTDADTYFDYSLLLLEQLNASGVRALFEENIGKRLSATRVRAAFDDAFGKGAGERVRLSCSEGLIEELRIGLAGVVDDTAELGELILAAPKRSPDCRGGWVDRAGVDTAR
ncbi:ribonuclease T2 family protein [Thiocapsa marina]|uniref:Ribonuclease T2 n=1 Tax=Thiocapsa marina 5811 TaxID=768671 RepID=F9U869_9GAMM|nr:ribonuclease T2 [Thiocapsa marina]EGV19481.1 ribonuclease T2 [Thiocapsa marina 5811]